MDEDLHVSGSRVVRVGFELGLDVDYEGGADCGEQTGLVTLQSQCSVDASGLYHSQRLG